MKYVILFIIYIFPSIIVYKDIRKRHSKGGIDEDYDIDSTELIYLLPLLNIGMVIWIFIESLSEEFKDKFFRIKK